MQAICSLGYGNISCCTTEKILSKVILKCPSIPRIAKSISEKLEQKASFIIPCSTWKGFKDISQEFVNLQSQLVINQKFEKDPLVFIIVNEGSYVNSLFIRKETSEVSYKKVVLKNFAIFTGKHLCWSHFLRQLQAFKHATLFKSDSNTYIFLWILRNF